MDTKAASVVDQASLHDDGTLPKIEFRRINKIRVQNLWRGTGKAVRDDLLTTGGFPKFFRTKRQNLLINKPASMFEDTHQCTSGAAQTLRHPARVAAAIANEFDTSFCINYDEPGATAVKLAGISQHMRSTLDPEFDYGYRECADGTSVKNQRRKSQYNVMIDHINNPHQLLNQTMDSYFKKTYDQKNVDRDTCLD
jgi:hypothetical protein